jgi:hypothetical protein
MSKRKEAKAKAAATAARNAIICPKCSHPLEKHGAYVTFFEVYTAASPKSGCRAFNERKHDDGFARLLPCNCDLKPDEVELNAKYKNAPQTVDAVIAKVING